MSHEKDRIPLSLLPKKLWSDDKKLESVCDYEPKYFSNAAYNLFEDIAVLKATVEKQKRLLKISYKHIDTKEDVIKFLKEKISETLKLALEIKLLIPVQYLEAEAKAIEDAVNDYANNSEATIVYIADLDCRVAELRNQAKLLREQI
jgi:hypothetical protein